jgi:hypothetical protein
MPIGVVAPKQRVVPRPTEALYSVVLRDVIFHLFESSTNAPVGLRKSPKLERVVQFIEPCDFQSSVTQVFKGVASRNEVIHTREFQRH